MSVYKVILNNGAMRSLSTWLGNGNLTDQGDVYRASYMIATQLAVLPDMMKIPEGTLNTEVEVLYRAWQKEGLHEFELSERERDTCKKAIIKAIEKGISAGPATLNLMMAFGLTPDGV